VTIQPQTIQPVRVLLVDDDVDFVASMKDLIEIEGYQVQSTYDAVAAMGSLREFNPDIALVDLRLGSDDGIGLIKEMMQLFPDLICVTVTAFSDTDSVISALQCGAYDFLRKPFEAEELFSVLRRCAEKCRLVREKREVDQALSESEARFRVSFEASPDSIIIARMEGQIINVNPAFERITGHRREHAIGKDSMDLGLWKNPKDREKLLEHVVQYGYANNMVAEFRMFDGSVRVGLASARTVMLGGELVCQFVVRDIHDIMIREKALEESEQRYRHMSQEYGTVLDGIPDALMLIDLDMKIIWANRGAGKHFGYSPEEMKGQNCSDIWKCEAQSCLEEAFKTGEAGDAIQHTPDGRIWGVKCFPNKDDQGNVTNVVQIASDLTEKTKLREAAARAAHLAAIGELAAGVAHEVNNPIGMILLDLAMLKDVFDDLVPILKTHPGLSAKQKIAGLPLEKLYEEIPPVIDEVLEGARKVKRIVEELRDFSKPSQLDMESVDISEVARKAVRMVRNPLKNATDFLTESYPAQPLLCLGNPHRLEQVVVNLLLNASQSLADKSAKISIETKIGAAAGMVQLIIQDEGCGIDPEQIKNITDPFYTSKREVGGTGLGLSVSSRIISEHNGLLSFQSQLGQGTTVVVELPTAEQGEPDAE
jgi:PAS domain S-box-containing protein